MTSRLPGLARFSLALWKTNNLAVLALMDRVAGDVSALKRVASHCSPPEDDATSYVDRPEGAFCFDMYFDLALHDIDLNGVTAPAGLVGVLEEVVSAEPGTQPLGGLARCRRRDAATAPLKAKGSACRGSAGSPDRSNALGAPQDLLPRDQRRAELPGRGDEDPSARARAGSSEPASRRPPYSALSRFVFFSSRGANFLSSRKWRIARRGWRRSMRGPAKRMTSCICSRLSLV